MRGDPQAVGKVMAEKLVRAESLELSLGRIWCPLKGLHVGTWVQIVFFSRSIRDRERDVLWRMVPGCSVKTW
jgi:hypothetical protein